MTNYYEILGVNQGATEDEIKDKLKEKKRLWVQRTNAPRLEQRQEAERLLKLVPEMEATLFDKNRRAEYDKKLRVAPREQSQVDAAAVEKAVDLVEQGWRLIAAGNIPDALFVATKATEKQGNSPDAWALLGYVHAQWGEVDKAIYEYDRAIGLRPNDAGFYFDLGGIYEGIEQWKKAFEQYQRAARIDPQCSAYRASMGSIFIKNEMYKEGIELLETCVREEPDNEQYKFLLALAYTESTYQNWTYVADVKQYLTTTMGHVREAEEYLQKAIALNVSDRDLQTRINEVRESVEAAKKKRFHGNILAVGAAILLGLFMLFSGDKNVIPAGLYLLVFGGLYAVSCMTPQYRLNDRIIKGGGETSAGMLFSGFSEGFGAGCFGMVFMMAIILALLPIMTIWNFIKNYAME